jgi:hypothetical protein
MDHLTDDDLYRLTSALATVLHSSNRWHEPPRLYGLLPRSAPPGRTGVLAAGGRRWLGLAEGDPYSFLDTVRISEREASALALVACGWATSTVTARRTRMRTVVVVTPDRRQCASLDRRHDHGGIVIDDRTEGPMMRALLAAWTTDELTGPPSAA